MQSSTPTPTATSPDAPAHSHDQASLLAKFNQTVTEFVGELRNTFPELQDTIDERYGELSSSSTDTLEWFKEQVQPHHVALMTKDAKVFRENEAVFLLPDINFSQLWKCKLTKANKTAIWKYLHVLMLLVSHMVMSATSLAAVAAGAASKRANAVTGAPGEALPGLPEADMQEAFAQWGKMLNDRDLTEEEMAKMRTHAESMMRLMESLGADDDGEDEDEETGAEGEGEKTGPSAFAEKLKGDPFLKTLENSKIAQFAKELSSELSMDDLGMGPDAKLESFQDVMGVLGKNPNGLMGLVQSVGNKIQNKMQTGDIKQTDLVAEAHTLMQSMQGSPAFKEMFQKMGKMGKRGRRGQRGAGAGMPGFDPQKLFQTMASQMGNMPAPSAEEMAAMQRMMPSASGPVATDVPNALSTEGRKKGRKGKKGRRRGGAGGGPSLGTLAEEPLD